MTTHGSRAGDAYVHSTLRWGTAMLMPMKPMAEVSPRLLARIAGCLYLLIFIAAPSGAATATPLNISITLACDVGVAQIFLHLFRPVNARLAWLALVFRLLFVAVMAVISLQYFGVLSLVADARAPQHFNLGYGIALAPFGAHCVLIGYLAYRSTFLPRLLGVLMAIAGLGYLTFIWPPLGDALFMPFIVIPGVVGEGSLTLWLLIKGVNAERWQARLI